MRALRNRSISLIVVMAFLVSPLQAQAQKKSLKLKSPAYTALDLPEDSDVWIPFKCSNLLMVDEEFKKLRKERGAAAEDLSYQAVTGELMEVLPPIEEDPDQPGKLIERPECYQLWIELFQVLYAQQMEVRQPASEHLRRFARSLKEFDPTLFDAFRARLIPPIVPSEPLRMKNVVDSMDQVKIREVGKVFENSWDPHLDLRDETDEESMELEEGEVIDDLFLPPGIDARELAVMMGVPLWMPTTFRSLASRESQSASTNMDNEDLWRYSLLDSIIKPVIFDSADKISIEQLAHLRDLAQAYVLLPPSIKTQVDIVLSQVLMPPGSGEKPTPQEFALGSWFPRTEDYLSQKIHEGTAWMQPIDMIFRYDRYLESARDWVELAPKVMDVSKIATFSNQMMATALLVDSVFQPSLSIKELLIKAAVSMKGRVEPRPLSSAASEFWRFYRNPLINEMRLTYGAFQAEETHSHERFGEALTLTEMALSFIIGGKIIELGGRGTMSLLSRIATRLPPGAVRILKPLSHPLFQKLVRLEGGMLPATAIFEYSRLANSLKYRGDRSRIKIYWDWGKRVLVISGMGTIIFVGAETLPAGLAGWLAGAEKVRKAAALSK